MPEVSAAGGIDPESFAAFAGTLERFVRERLIPAEAEVVAADRVPDHLIAEMRALGLFGTTIPPRFGGAGMNVSQAVEAARILSYALPAYKALTSLNVGMLNSALTRFGTEAQQAEWLPRLAGGAIGCFALTEPESGSDAAALRTRALRDGGDYVLSGTKRYITNAPLAEVALVLARTQADPLPRNAHVSAFLVPMDTKGVSVGPPEAKMGQRGSQIADILLEDVRVPADALLGGREGLGFTAAMASLDTGRLSVAASSAGYGQRILDTALRYARERKAFGGPIANFQLVQAMLADSAAELYAARCMIADACRLADEGAPVTLEAASAKMFASEACGRIADRCVQIHGGAGYLAAYEAERLFRDSRVFRIYEGTTQIMQLVIARQLLRKAAA